MAAGTLTFVVSRVLAAQCQAFSDHSRLGTAPVYVRSAADSSVSCSRYNSA
jgi:hypothetical protein